MKIEWNKVTRLSQIVAVVLFVAVYIVGFQIGRVFQAKLILGNKIAQAKFICDKNVFINADFYDRMAHLEFSDGRVLYLPQTISGSGARYADKGESIVFWNKGDTAFVVQNGTTTISGCVVE